MKKIVSILLVALMLLSCVTVATPSVYAAKKAESSRAIAIVFDNSRSMYMEGKADWCHATYAMEVFASMLNKGDTLQIYPMHPITVKDKEYTMDSPYVITDASQAKTIRDIYTAKAYGTPMKTVDAAAAGVQAVTADKKYLIVLTDGDYFDDWSKDKSKKELDKRFQKYLSEGLNVMYLGVNKVALMPDTAESAQFTKRHAKNSADTLAALTEMCNKIFGRDTLPKSHLTDKKIKLDMSISKLIVFVQGENVTDLKVTGTKGEVGQKESSASTKYSTKGAGNEKSVPDKSLQGMMVTYTDCSAGNYTISFKGKATSIEVYYEPDADLDFVFTDSDGNLVDPNELYEGEYKVSFGMKDAKTGQLIDSELLGNPHYEGSYYINGEEFTFSKDGKNGEVPIELKMGDSFEAKLKVDYLSGYTITKDSTDFGWPKGGIKVAARPAGNLKLKITGGDRVYSLQDLDKGGTYKAEVYYQGKKLTGEELKKVELKWNPDTSYAEIKKEFADDHYKLKLHYKDEKNPANTTCGKCKVSIQSIYTPQGSEAAKATATLSYRIEDDFVPVKLDLTTSQDYIVIKELEKSEAITANVTMKGKPLTAEDFKSVQLKVDCGGINYKVTPNEKDSSFSIKLLPTEGIAEGDYPVKVTAVYTDHIGRETQVEDEMSVTLSNTPLWLRWLLIILLIIAIILIIWAITRIKAMPKRLYVTDEDAYMSIGGRAVADGTEFNAKRSGKKVEATVEYAGNIAGVVVNNVEPGKNSYIVTPQQKRAFLAKPENVRVIGDVTRVDIDNTTFTVKDGIITPDDEEAEPFTITNDANISFSGNVEDNGKTKKFSADIPVTFKK